MHPSSHVLLACLLPVLGACSSPRVLAAQCTLTSDCAEPLVCALGVCRTECVNTRDCALGSLCIATAAAGGACQLPAEQQCASGVDCPIGLVCSSGTCTNGCTSDPQCRSGLRCVAAACVECEQTSDCGRDLSCERGRCVAAALDGSATRDTGASDASTRPDAPPAPVDLGSAEDAGTERDAASCAPCDPVSGCGCSTPQTCQFDDDGTRLCRAAPSAAAVGASCSGSRCVSGAHCNYEFTSYGALVCRRVCLAESDCPMGSLCRIPLYYAGGSETTLLSGFEGCSIPCDPRNGGGCAGGMRCEIRVEPSGARRSFTDCRELYNPVGDGARCTDNSNCRATLTCEAGRCARTCRVGTDDCGGGAPCTPSTPTRSVNGVTYGTCL